MPTFRVKVFGVDANQKDVTLDQKDVRFVEVYDEANQNQYFLFDPYNAEFFIPGNRPRKDPKIEKRINEEIAIQSKELRKKLKKTLYAKA